MRITEIIFYLITLAGFCIKPLHIPGNTLVIMAGLLCLFIFYLYCLITSAKPLPYILTGMAALFIMASILCHVKFFLFASYVMDFAAFILFLAIVYSIRKKMYFRFLSSFVLLLMGVHIFILIQPRHKIYEFLNITYNIKIENDYQTWDKYSWFLFIDGHYDQSLEANKKALAIVQQTNDTAFARMVTEHGELITAKKWKKFKK